MHAGERTRVRRIAVIASLGLIAAGCSLLTSLDDLGQGDASADGSPNADASDGPTTHFDTCGNGMVCVPPVPSGWLGPLAFAETPEIADAGTPPSCLLGWNASASGSEVPADASFTCAAPSCGGIYCSSSGDYYFSGCQSQNNLSLDIDDTCMNFEGGAVGTSFMFAPAPYAAAGACGWGGTCLDASVVGDPLVVVVACGPSAAIDTTGCTGDQLCAPTSPAGFPARYCVSAAGDVACPAGAYAAKHVVYANATDTRKCGTVYCEVPDGATCPNQLTLYSQPGCAGTTQLITTFNQSSTCSKTSFPAYSAKVAGVVPANTQAVAVEPASSGDVTFSAPSTFCCTP